MEREDLEIAPRGWTRIVVGALGVVLLSVVAFDLRRIYEVIDTQNRTAQEVRTELTKVGWQIIGALAAIENLDRREAALEREVRDIRERSVWERGRRGER